MLSPYVSAIISFFIPGLGQICKGEIIKGIILFIIAAIIFIVLKTYLTQNIGLIYIYNLFTAYEEYRKKLNG